MRIIARASGKSRCVRCHEAIATGERCFERTIQQENPSKRTQVLHPACAVDVDAITVAGILEAAKDLDEPLAAVRELALARRAAIEHRRKGEWTLVHQRAPSISTRIEEPKATREDPRRLVRPAHDSRGRPRVRVLCAGGAFSLERATGRAIRELCPVGSWASSKREYVFVRGHKSSSSPETDPAQPIIGVVYGANATSTALIEGERDLRRFRAFGLPPPMLWLLGISSSSPRDAYTLRFRAVVDRCGFDADACPVQCAPKVTPEALDLLVGALDEHLDGVEWRLRDAPWRLMVRAIAEDIRRGDSERYGGIALEDRLESVWAMDDPRIAKDIDESVEVLIDRGELEVAPMLLARSLRPSTALIERLLRATLGADNAKPAGSVPLVCSVLARTDAEKMGTMLLDAARRATTKTRTRELLEVLQWQGTRADLARLEAWQRDGAPKNREALLNKAAKTMRERLATASPARS
jgi:hypothetical protein